MIKQYKQWKTIEWEAHVFAGFFSHHIYSD